MANTGSFKSLQTEPIIFAFFNLNFWAISMFATFSKWLGPVRSKKLCGAYSANKAKLTGLKNVI